MVQDSLRHALIVHQDCHSVFLPSAFSSSHNITRYFLVVGQFEFRVQASACFFRRMNVKSKLKLEL
jgi:hypothetical protein